jgi:hypothetical protein
VSTEERWNIQKRLWGGTALRDFGSQCTHNVQRFHNSHIDEIFQKESFNAQISKNVID